MLRAPDGVLVEVFTSPFPYDDTLEPIRHISFDADDVDGMLKRCAEAGYPAVTSAGAPSPSDVSSIIVMDRNPCYAMRWRYVKGFCVEIIEFQKELFPEE